MKRIVTVQDLSCVGKCSLSIALPILCAMGVETVALPTAVLSTHTAFPGAYIRDLTPDIEPITAHWKQQGIGFDAIYTGYLACVEQLMRVKRFVDEVKTNENFLVVDPVMADHGKLYRGFDEQFVRAMKSLCARADLIMPNITEAVLLLGEEYKAEHDVNDIESMLKRLSNLGPKTVMITGVSTQNDALGVMVYDRLTGRVFSHFVPRVPQNFSGTGDLFASTVVGAMMNGLSIEQSAKLAVDFVSKCMRDTIYDIDHRPYGVQYETAIPDLISMLKTAASPQKTTS